MAGVNSVKKKFYNLPQTKKQKQGKIKKVRSTYLFSYLYLYIIAVIVVETVKKWKSKKMLETEPNSRLFLLLILCFRFVRELCEKLQISGFSENHILVLEM